jgi:Uma2 family endonuclease
MWLIDLPDQVVRVYREPRDGTYRLVEVVRRGGTIRSLGLPSLVVDVNQLLGPAAT